jgi:hypothetical protein
VQVNDAFGFGGEVGLLDGGGSLGKAFAEEGRQRSVTQGIFAPTEELAAGFEGLEVADRCHGKGISKGGPRGIRGGSLNSIMGGVSLFNSEIRVPLDFYS